jgi:uncharacterized membrane protein
MKKIIAFCLMFFLVCVSSVEAKSYSYDYINIFLDFFSNGTVLVKQERAYNFQGSFSWAYLDVKKQGAQDIKFIEIRDLDAGNVPKHNLTESSDYLRINWYYSANDEVKKFQIAYEIVGAVKSYEDVAEFYWKVIEEEHELIRSLHGEVNLPQPSPNLFKVFIHSRANPGTLSFSDDLKKAIVDMGGIPKDSFVEFRVLTSPSTFPGVPLARSKKYEAILSEEEEIFQSDQTYSFTYSAAIYAILTANGIMIFLYFYFKYGKEPEVCYQLEYEQEPPRDIPPMALAAIYGENTQASARGLLATIFDLARRGYLEIREEKKKRFLWLGEKTEQIFKITKKGMDEMVFGYSTLGFERDVLRLLFVSMSKFKEEVSSSEMTEWCQKNPARMRSFLPKLNKYAKLWFENNYFKVYEPKSLKESGKFAVVLICYFALAFVVLLLSGAVQSNPILTGAFIVGGILLVVVGVHAVKRKTPEATLEIKRWKAFKKYISDFSAMKDAPVTLLHIWDRYLVYAVVLGVADELLENVKNLSLERHAQVAAVAWYHPVGAPGIPTGMMSPQAFSSFSSNMSNMISALSSSSSVGGGFSGGAGGGGGGGGGGGSGAG